MSKQAIDECCMCASEGQLREAEGALWCPACLSNHVQDLKPLQDLIAASRGDAETVMMSRQVWDVLLGKVQDERRELLKSPAKPRVADVLLAVLVAGLHVRARHAQG